MPKTWKPNDIPFEALIFDLDGVISDTERVIHEVWSDLFADHGCFFTKDEWSSIVGTDSAEFDPLQALIERSNLPLLPPARLKEMIDEQVEAAAGSLGALPGVEEWMKEARVLGLAVAVASSSPRPWVERRLSDAGVEEHVQIVSCRDQSLRAKPAPDVYEDACRRLDVDPRRAVAIEDSTNGITAAVSAGLTCIAVRNDSTYEVDTSLASLVINSLAEVEVAQALAVLGR